MGIVQIAIAALPRIPKRDPTISRNPIVLFAELSKLDWAFFAAGLFAWTCVSALLRATSAVTDFDLGCYRFLWRFSVRHTTRRPIQRFDCLDYHFDHPHSSLPFGRRYARASHPHFEFLLIINKSPAVIFGLISDRFGRKWPLVANLLIVAVLSLATAFCNTFQSFLAVRSLFGIGMGGIWGMSVACALENMPVGARGLGQSLAPIPTIARLIVVPHLPCSSTTFALAIQPLVRFSKVTRSVYVFSPSAPRPFIFHSSLCSRARVLERIG